MAAEGAVRAGPLMAEPLSTIVQRASTVPGSGNSSSPCTSRYPNLPGSTKNALAVAPDLLAAVADEHRLERRVAVGTGRGAHQHDEVRRELRRIRGHRGREERTGDVDPGRRPFDLAKVDGFDEQGGDDLHDRGPYPPGIGRHASSTTSTARGPCTPSVVIISRSPVRLGPPIHVSALGRSPAAIVAIASASVGDDVGDPHHADVLGRDEARPAGRTRRGRRARSRRARRPRAVNR